MNFDEIGCMLDKESAKAMFELFSKLPLKGRLLELGTGWGHSAKFFSECLPGWAIYTIDAFGLYGDGRIYNEYNPEAVKKIIDGLPRKVIQILSDTKRVKWELALDVLYIDADHTYEGCFADFSIYSKFLKKGGLLIFDDYIQENNPANGVKQVVDAAWVQKKFEVLYSGISIILRKR